MLAADVVITDPIFEKAIRNSLNKPTGELTKADLEEVTELTLWSSALTALPVFVGQVTVHLADQDAAILVAYPCGNGHVVDAGHYAHADEVVACIVKADMLQS